MDWESEFIKAAKETVLQVYNESYAPTHEIKEPEMNNDDDDLFDHIFSKAEQRNELELYLKGPRAGRKQNVLQWWQVG
jgi:hypothetical protein